MFPKFLVPGVPEDQVWQLFNVSNYAYYKLKVKDLRAGTCPFCSVDPKVNSILYENDSWMVWRNEVSPRDGQDYQFVIPSKKHTDYFVGLEREDLPYLYDAAAWIDNEFNLEGGVLLIRTGNPSRNAKSVPHLHANYLVPTGVDRVVVTIAKSQADLDKKLPILLLFERMRLAEEAGVIMPLLILSQAEQELVGDKLGPPGK